MSIPTDIELLALAQKLAQRFKLSGKLLVTAESCTGGWIAKLMTDIVGSSSWFERGFVTYSNEAKHESLGVSQHIIETHGAVSEETIRAMAEGALLNSHAHISACVSGIAGPGGGTDLKPVGTVWFAWGQRDSTDNQAITSIYSEQCLFKGDRDEVRRQAVAHAIKGIMNILDEAG